VVPFFEWVVEDLSKNHAVTAPTSTGRCRSPRRTPLCWTQLRAGGRALEETWLDREDVERLERMIAQQGG
jgi:hypothetical protein